MSDIPPRQLAAWALAALAIVVLAAWYLSRGEAGAAPPRAPAAAIEVKDGGDSGLVVHVAGAVHNAGVYRMRSGARVSDAVARAGGATRHADLAQVNLAAPVADGEQIVVPRRQVRADGSPGVGAAAGPSASTGPVHLNTATAEQLDALPGIGPATAQKILDYRQAHGAFTSVDELDAVPGIGPAKLDELKGLVAP
jgi:competence protein ComEA